MPHDFYRGQTQRIGRGRALMDMLAEERFQVSCRKCSRTAVHGRSELWRFPQGLPISHFEENMPPRCWGFAETRPADCQREVIWLDVSPEDCGVGD